MQEMTFHGVFMDIAGIGVLLTGDAGIGKSSAALELIDRGQRLIADDAVIFSCTTNQEIIGRCPELLRDFLEVRGLGVLNIRRLFGAAAILEQQTLQLIIKLTHQPSDPTAAIDRLSERQQQQTILGVAIPEISISVTPGCNISLLIECTARNQVLKASGYDARTDLIQRQNKLMF